MKEPTTQEEYLAYGGIQCPFCGSSDIDSCGSPELEYGLAVMNVRCESCEKEWREYYELSGYEAA